MAEKIDILLEVFQDNLKNVKTDIENLRKDVKDLQISTAKSGVQTALIWSMATAFIVGIIGMAVKFVNSGGAK